MNNYYGILSNQNESFLQHYGVLGMKWGVRKAIKKNNSKKLRKEYKQAIKKLNEYKQKADIQQQMNAYKKQRNKAVSGALNAGLATGVGGAVLGASNKMVANKILTGLSKGAGIATLGSAAYKIGKTSYHASKAIAAKRRTKPKGHQKAVRKYERFNSELNKAFEGTPYEFADRNVHRRKFKRVKT
jgi:hypothetical protein